MRKRKKEARESLRVSSICRPTIAFSPSVSLSTPRLTFQELADVLDELCARQARRPLLLLLGLLLSFGRRGRRSHIFRFDRLSSSSLEGEEKSEKNESFPNSILQSPLASLSFKMACSIRADSSRVLWRLASSSSSAAVTRRAVVFVLASPSAASSSSSQRLIVAASASSSRFSSARSATAAAASPSSLRAPSSCEPLRKSNSAR